MRLGVDELQARVDRLIGRKISEEAKLPLVDLLLDLHSATADAAAHIAAVATHYEMSCGAEFGKDLGDLAARLRILNPALMFACDLIGNTTHRDIN
jgi:hypothetical protein